MAWLLDELLVRHGLWCDPNRLNVTGALNTMKVPAVVVHAPNDGIKLRLTNSAASINGNPL